MLKRKRGVALAIVVAMAFSILPAKVINAAGFTRNESESGLKKLDLDGIKAGAEEIYKNERKNGVDKLSESDLYINKGEETAYKSGDSVRVIVELKESNKKTKILADKENKTVQDTALKEIESSSVDINVRHKFTEGMNALSGEVKFEDIEKIEKLDGIESVRIAKVYKANLNSSNNMIQAQEVWNQLGYKGEGMVVGILDTGFQVDHKDLKLGEKGKEEAKLTPENLSGKLNSTEIDDIYYNEKFPTGYDWADMNNDIAPADLYQGNHGMHVAGIIGGNGDVDNGGVVGIAPEVQIIGEKIFSDDGKGYEDDIIAGIKHATEMGADVINMSLGSDVGFVDENEDLMQIAIKESSEKGVLVVVSAGNAYYSTQSLTTKRANPYKENFDMGTVGDPSVTSYALSVASIDNNSLTANIGELSNGDVMPYLNQVRYYPVITKALEEKEYEIVYAGKGTYNDFKDLDCTGKVVLVNLDSSYNANVALQNQVKRAGGIAVIAASDYDYSYNVTVSGVPLVATSKEEGLKISEKINNGETIKIKFTNKTTLVSQTEDIVTSEFSSWGSAPNLDFKPEISGVGGNIYSTTPDGEHITMSGTSMSSPQVAGAGAIMLQTLKEKGEKSSFETVMKAKNMLMNNTSIVENKLEDVPYSTRKQGAGLLQLENAINTTLLAYDDNAELQKRGSIALKEIGSTVKFNVALESIVEENLEYDVYVDLYTDTFATQDVDINLDGETDFTKEGNLMKSRKVNGGKVSINGETSSNNENGNIKLGGEEKEVIEITLDLSNSDVENNTFIEGYVRIVPKNSELNDINIPLMGFYGDWNDAPNLDEAMIDGQPYTEYTAVFGYDEDLPLGYSRQTGEIDENKVAFSYKSFMNAAGISISALRNLEYLKVEVQDEDGNHIKTLDSYDYLTKNTFYNSNIAYRLSDYDPWDATDDNGEFVKDGQYKFVAKSKFDYKNAKEQQLELKVKVDATDPTVSNVVITQKGEKHEITFDVLDETSGYEGAIIYIDNEYFALERGEKSILLDTMPNQVVVVAFDNAGNSGLGLVGEGEINPDILLAYYSVRGENINYENSLNISGIGQKNLNWKLKIVSPTEEVLYEFEAEDESMLSLEFTPDKGEPNGSYKLLTRIEDASGIGVDLEEHKFEVVDNEIYDKSGLFKSIMSAKDYLNTIIIGEEVGQYTQETVDEFNKVLYDVENVYYEAASTEENILEAIKIINDGLENFKADKNPDLSGIIVEKARNLKIKEVTQNLVNITWEAPENNTNIVEYNIYLDGKIRATVKASEILEYSIEGLRSNTIYGVKVVSKTKSGALSKPISLNLRTL